MKMAENQSKIGKNDLNFIPPGASPQKFWTHLFTGKLIVILKALLHIKIVLFCLINHNYKIIWNA